MTGPSPGRRGGDGRGGGDEQRHCTDFTQTGEGRKFQQLTKWGERRASAPGPACGTGSARLSDRRRRAKIGVGKMTGAAPIRVEGEREEINDDSRLRWSPDLGGDNLGISIQV